MGKGIAMNSVGARQGFDKIMRQTRNALNQQMLCDSSSFMFIFIRVSQPNVQKV